MARCARVVQGSGVAEMHGAWAAAIDGGLLSCLSMDARDRLVTRRREHATICFTLAMYVWFTRWPLATRCLISAVCSAFRLITKRIGLPFSLCGALWLRGILPRRDLRYWPRLWPECS